MPSDSRQASKSPQPIRAITFYLIFFVTLLSNDVVTFISLNEFPYLFSFGKNEINYREQILNREVDLC